MLLPTLVSAAVPSPEIRCVSLDSNDNITLSWDIPPDPLGEFQAYNIYISNNNITFNLAANILTYNQSSFTQNGSFSGIIFYYIETVFNDGSGIDTASASDTVSPIIINLNTAVPEVATISWNPIRATPLTTQGDFYRIFRRISPTGSWVLVDSVPNTVFTFTENLDFCSDSIYYRVEIPDDLPCLSISNLAKDIHQKLPPNPPTIDSISVNPLNGNVIISWTPDPSDLDLQGFIIIHEVNGLEFKDTIYGANQVTYVDTGVNAGLGSQIYGVAAFDTCNVNGFGNVSPTNVRFNTLFLEVTPSPCDLNNTLEWNLPDLWPVGIVNPLNVIIYSQEGSGPVNAIAVLDPTDTLYVDSNLTAGSTYCYIVQVVASNGMSASSNISCGALTGPAAPQKHYLNYTTVEADRWVEVSCLVDNSPGVDNYLLMRSISPDGPFHRVERVPVSLDTLVTFRDPTASPGEHSYYYRVDAIDICKTVVEESNVSQNIRLVGEVEENRFINTLSWNRYADWDTAGSGVSGYELYRSFNGVFDPLPIATFSHLDTTYEDDIGTLSQADGRFCYYVVASENAGGKFNLQATSQSNTICLIQPTRIFVPNAFHPGGKGENDAFRPSTWYADPSDYYLAIHTRWGEKIFETTDVNKGWDGGSYNLGVYLYHVIVTTSKGEKVEKRGSVTLLR